MNELVVWVPKRQLPENEIAELKTFVGVECEVIQLRELDTNIARTLMFVGADVLAFQSGSLPPELHDLVTGHGKAVERITDRDFNFVGWRWYNRD